MANKRRQKVKNQIFSETDVLNLPITYRVLVCKEVEETQELMVGNRLSDSHYHQTKTYLQKGNYKPISGHDYLSLLEILNNEK